MKEIVLAVEHNAEKLDRIKKNLPLEEILAQVAEESAELSQAALKYRRAIMDVNPTPLSQIEAREQFQQEFGDTLLSMLVAGIDSDDVIEIIYKKSTRWCKRLGV